MPKLFPLVRRRALAALAFALPLAVAACRISTDAPPVVPVLTTVDSTTFAPSLGVDLAASTKTANGVYYRDITAGSGTVATLKKTVSITYKGQFADGRTFDATPAGGAPISFVLGEHAVIFGLEDGMTDMRVGGTRQIVMPPSVAYGAYDYRGIPGNSVLVFTITLVSVQ